MIFKDALAQASRMAVKRNIEIYVVYNGHGYMPCTESQIAEHMASGRKIVGVADPCGESIGDVIVNN